MERRSFELVLKDPLWTFMIELIDKHDKDPPAPKKKAKKHGDEEPLKKQLKKEDLANLAEGRKAKVTRKEK